MDKKNAKTLFEYYEEVETTEPHDGYFCSVGGAITIVILGTFCGFKNLKQIHQGARHAKIQETLMEEHFREWVRSLLPEGMSGQTIALDGKTIRSTGTTTYQART
jgi:hypothetical protein